MIKLSAEKQLWQRMQCKPILHYHEHRRKRMSYDTGANGNGEVVIIERESLPACVTQ